MRCGLAGRSISWCREVRVASDPVLGGSALDGGVCARILEPAAKLPSTQAARVIASRRLGKLFFIMSLRINLKLVWLACESSFKFPTLGAIEFVKHRSGAVHFCPPIATTCPCVRKKIVLSEIAGVAMHTSPI